MRPLCEAARFFLGSWYCSRRCAHDGGDRTACNGWDCGCTRYSKMRRMLRKHRAQMRITEDYLVENGFDEELEDRIIEETGNTPIHLDRDSEMDEHSDAPDPEADLREEVRALRQEAADQRAFIAASRGMTNTRMDRVQ
jgi:hypothetical protein